MFKVVGDSTGRDKSTVSRIISNVTDSMVDIYISSIFITWPNCVQQQEIMREFFTSAGFPNVIGAVDSSHIRIFMPKDGHDFINRKNFASINVMAVSDSKGRFTFLDARWPGSSHDSFIYRASDLADHMDAMNRSWTDGILIADIGVMMTPYRVADTQQKISFNRAHSRTRVAVEMAFGRWKHRFGILHGEEPDVDDVVPVAPQPGEDYRGQEQGQAIRDHIARAYFT
ncbi:putative nuclease HARBI1 [Mya arenaria]|uniref:putative nuclease HARBI1 n=1 Tax=Mya arenaria TaxID=6604 RepID=UPI0022E6FE2F|nr:putative nuclease HARBI1 [Mya arenaria]